MVYQLCFCGFINYTSQCIHVEFNVNIPLYMESCLMKQKLQLFNRGCNGTIMLMLNLVHNGLVNNKRTVHTFFTVLPN